MKSAKKKNNKYAQVVQAELDLHGVYQDAARTMVGDFLREAEKNSFSRVRIIVGKGNHSAKGEGVLCNMVKSLLNKEGYIYAYAKMQDGGEGVIEVQMNKKIA